MRPALRRLLSRPTSIELLRYLIGSHAYFPHIAPIGRSQQCLRIGEIRTRGYGDLSNGDRRDELYGSRSSNGGNKRARERTSPRMATSRTQGYAIIATDAVSEDSFGSETVRSDNKLRAEELGQEVKTNVSTENPESGPTETQNGTAGLSVGYYGPWKKPNIWTAAEIEFESNLNASENTARQRLVDQRQHKMDMHLFARLLDYRERIYGMEGIRMFWEAVKERRIRLPTRDYRESKNRALPAEKLWTSFLRLGFYDKEILEEIWAYADKLLNATQRRWPRLYATIVQHFLVSGEGNEAVKWHKRLTERHPPSAIAFAEMCHQTVRRKGDLNALQEIYDENQYHNVYGKIVPTLCWQEDFKAATEWHFKLIAKGDIPMKSQHAQALSRFLAVYDRPNAVKVTKSLVAAGAPFQISKSLTSNVKISREIMNLVHGETFKISVKSYNDEYGARWFATTWIPLDLTMHSVHALGIREIGPLSLQALCLRREPDGSEAQPHTILCRIEQLRTTGISTGTSVFSRAVEHFARNGLFIYLMSLLKSDQHPEALEDWKSLEDLLAYYARIRDWEQYGRIQAIRTLGKKSPNTEAQNVWLRTQVTNGDIPAALDILEKMQANGTTVTTTTIAYILQSMLSPRRSGRKLLPGTRNLDMVTGILKSMMKAGTLVPAVHWREVLRRFGMMRSNAELRDLCLFLASQYGPTNDNHLAQIGIKRAHVHRVPSQVISSHPLHPFRILFPVRCQKAIVAWGFISAFREAGKEHPAAKRGISPRLGYESDINRQVTAGISLLRELYQVGVHIDKKAIKKAIFDRLVIYYSPGRSTKLYNRLARRYVPELRVMTRLIDDAMGQQTFDFDLEHKIASQGMLRLGGRARKAKAREMKR